MREYFFEKWCTRICDAERSVGFINAKDPEDAVTQVRLEAHCGSLDEVKVWADANAYHKKEQPLAVWPQRK